MDITLEALQIRLQTVRRELGDEQGDKSLPVKVRIDLPEVSGVIPLKAETFLVDDNGQLVLDLTNSEWVSEWVVEEEPGGKKK